MQTMNLESTAAYLRACEDVCILIHRSPDGDCIGAGYSLLAVLRQMGKRARVRCADPIPKSFSFLLPDAQEEDFPEKCIISVDVADENLFGALKETYAGRVDLCIDHHISNLHYAKRTLLRADAAAACEILYALYRHMGVTFDEEIAKCLYTGMATDTGCFRFDNTTPDTHIYTAELMREFPSIRYGWINRQMFEVKSPERIRAEILMLEHMEYALDGRCTLVWATREVFDATGLDDKDTEGLTALSLQPAGVEVGLTIREREPGVYKVSIRSAGDVNVSAICRQFDGGGHIKAAGCQIRGTQEEVRSRLVAAVEAAL